MTATLHSHLLTYLLCGLSRQANYTDRATSTQLLLGLARAVTHGSKSHRTHGHILLSHLRLPQPGGPGPCIYIPQEQGGRYTPRHWVPLLSPLNDSQGYGVGILTRLHMGLHSHCCENLKTNVLSASSEKTLCAIQLQ
jgi:hypothetical protein